MTEANEGLEGREEGGTWPLRHGGVRGRTRVGISVVGGKAACGGFGGESIGLSDTKREMELALQHWALGDTSSCPSGGHLVFKSPVARTEKRLQLNWTATYCNWTSICSPLGCLGSAVAVAPDFGGPEDRAKTS